MCALVALVANEVRVPGIAAVFLGGRLGARRSGDSAAGIRRVSDQRVERFRVERGKWTGQSSVDTQLRLCA